MNNRNSFTLYIFVLIAINVNFFLTSCGKVDCPSPNQTKYNYNFAFTKQTTGTTKFLKGIDFIDTLNGFVVGDGGTILKTIDGGKSFTQISTGTLNDLYRIEFPSSKIGYCIGNNRTILKTTDGGLTWTSKISELAGEHMRSIYFFNDSVGVVAGSNGKLFRTNNGGDTWNVSVITVNSILFSNRTIYSMHWIDENNGFLGCNWGDLIKYSNGTFTQLEIGTTVVSTSAIWDMHFLDSKLAVAAHANYPSEAVVKKTFNKWASFSNNYIHPDDSLLLWSVDFFDKFKGIAVGGNVLKSNGVIITTTDGGTTWTKDTMKYPTLANIEEVNGKLIIVGDSGTLLTNSIAK